MPWKGFCPLHVLIFFCIFVTLKRLRSSNKFLFYTKITSSFAFSCKHKVRSDSYADGKNWCGTKVFLFFLSNWDGTAPLGVGALCKLRTLSLRIGSSGTGCGGILAHSSLQNCFNSATLEGFRAWMDCLKSCHSISIRFKSGLWLGHSKTLILLFLSHSEVNFLVCLGSLSCYITQVCLRPQTDGRTFSFRIFW